MPRGLSRCWICGKPAPSVYRPFHEKHQCREMRRHRGAKGIREGMIYIAEKAREWKPDLSDLPGDAHFARRLWEVEAGYPIQGHNAQAEGGYTPEEYEALYERLHPGWTQRWAYIFTFFTVDDLIECGVMKADDKEEP